MEKRLELKNKSDDYERIKLAIRFIEEKFKDQPIAGHITLVKGERSELAELAAGIL